MPNYRRSYAPGGTFFLTVATYQRRPTFSPPGQAAHLRRALKHVMREAPFHIPAAVVLPDHAHFLWTLPRGDSDYSRRVGQMKVLFTRSLGRSPSGSDVCASRRRHREVDVWQHRFWEHTIADEEDFERHADYIHYNPVKHGLATCRPRLAVFELPPVGPGGAFPPGVGLSL